MAPADQSNQVVLSSDSGFLYALTRVGIEPMIATITIIVIPITGLFVNAQKTKETPAPMKQNISSLLVPPTPYFKDRRAKIRLNKTAMPGCQSVSLAPER